LAFSSTRCGKQAIAGLVSSLAVNPVPGESQGQGVTDLGALEHFTDDIRADPVDALVASEVLFVHRHVERREILCQQIYGVIGRDLRVRATRCDQPQKRYLSNCFQHLSLAPCFRRPERKVPDAAECSRSRWIFKPTFSWQREGGTGIV